MLNCAQQIAGYLARYRLGDCENAFHSLLDLGPEALPALAEQFRAEIDPAIRVLLVKVIWKLQDKSAVPFLGTTLFDVDPQVWKEALDGLVALGSPAAIEAIRAAKTRKFAVERDEAEFSGWLEEAIEQVESGPFGREGKYGRGTRPAQVPSLGLIQARKKEAAPKTSASSPDLLTEGDTTKDPALEELRAQAELAPRDLHARFRLGRALLRSGNAEGAIPELQRATQHPEYRKPAMILLVEAFDSIKKPDMADARRRILEKLAASRNVRRSALDAEIRVRQSIKSNPGPQV